jgi:hypothetical protein
MYGNDQEVAVSALGMETAAGDFGLFEFFDMSHFSVEVDISQGVSGC